MFQLEHKQCESKKLLCDLNIILYIYRKFAHEIT